MGKRANGEGSWSYSRVKKLYTYRYTFPEGRKSFTGKTKAMCLDRFKTYQAYREENGIRLTTKTTVQEYYKHFLAKTKVTLGVATYDTYVGYMTTIKGSEYDLMNKPVTCVTTEMLKDYYNGYQKSIRFSTARRIKQILLEMFNLAVSENLMTVNPVSGLTLNQNMFSEQKEHVFFNEEEMRIFTDTVMNGGSYADVCNARLMLLFIAHTGVRVGELMGLRWCDVRKDAIFINHNRIRVKEYDDKFKTVGSEFVLKVPKTQSSIRKIPLDKQARELIAYFQEIRSGEYVFVQDNGNLPEREIIRYHLKQVCEEGNLPSLTTHELRHTFGSLLLAKDIDIKVVSKLLGHSSVTTTYNIYIHLTDNQYEEAVSVLDTI